MNLAVAALGRSIMFVSAQWSRERLISEVANRAPPPPASCTFMALAEFGAPVLTRWRGGQLRPTLLWRRFRATLIQQSPFLVMLHDYPAMFASDLTAKAELVAVSDLLIGLGQEIGAPFVLIPPDGSPLSLVILPPTLDHPVMSWMGADDIVLRSSELHRPPTLH
jgi:hypothetical protein